MLSLVNISKSYSSQLIFTIPALELPKGIYWLKGSNGAGKSTLLKTMAGLLPFKGDITLNKTISLKKNPVSYRFLVNHAEAEPQFPAFLTGGELTRFVSGVKKGTEQQIAELKDILGIDNYLDNPTGSYSSGMLKKLSLLLAFIGQPEWILLDEPLTTLDLATQDALCRLINQKHQAGISFLLTSHHDIDMSVIAFNGIFLVEYKQVTQLTR
ncbi:MAG: ATP-binding cassette domain-containing protein [Bacteroidota bacterium]